jgi:hypothetical protein
VAERYSHLTRLRAEHVRISALLASLEGETRLNRLRIALLQQILAALENAIRFEESR